MKPSKGAVLATASWILAACASPPDAPPSLGGQDYFGQTRPGSEPAPFTYHALGIQDQRPRIPVYSRDGSMVVFNMGEPSQIHIARRVDGRWGPPRRASFSDVGRNWEPFLMPDQRTLLFGSTRPPGRPPHTGRIWLTVLQDDGSWSAPRLALNTAADTGLWYPNGPRLREIYFSAELPGAVGGADLWVADLTKPGEAPVRLPEPLNSASVEWDPYLLPGGEAVLFASDRPGGYGRADLYIAFRGAAGGWGAPRNLGPRVNTSRAEVASAVSPDGRHLFFVREPNEVFWIDAQLLRGLRPAGSGSPPQLRTRSVP